MCHPCDTGMCDVSRCSETDCVSVDVVLRTSLNYPELQAYLRGAEEYAKAHSLKEGKE